jgi:4-hydroxy-2-oxoheptanedioate aldolase
MLENRIKRIIRDGGVAIAAHGGCFRDPEVIELIGQAGYDGVFIDMEHTGFDLRDIQVMVLAAERHGITPIVRTAGFDEAMILRLLDIGVQGVYVPHVQNLETARRVVAAARYTPLGDRGVLGFCRAAAYGQIPLKEHMAQSNREVMLTLMIEDKEALNEIESIAALDGVDFIAPAPNDLGASLGIPGQADHPKLVGAMARIIEAVRKAGKARLTLPVAHPLYPRTAAECKDLGASLVLCGAPPQVRLLRSYTQEVAEVRGALKK